MQNKELIQLTIKDLQETQNKILERHKDDLTLSLRLGSVFKQLINSLNINGGNVVSTQVSSFEPKPLTKVLGKEIKEKKNAKLELKPIEVDEVEAFKEKIQLVYDSFMDRDTTDLLDSLTEIEIRGVAKLAGVENFDKAPVDGVLINAIKSAITAKEETEKKQEEELKNLNAPEPEPKNDEPAKEETEKKQEEGSQSGHQNKNKNRKNR